MKKWFSIFLVMCMFLSAVGCGQQESGTGGQEKQTEVSVSEPEQTEESTQSPSDGSNAGPEQAEGQPVVYMTTDMLSCWVFQTGGQLRQCRCFRLWKAII